MIKENIVENGKEEIDIFYNAKQLDIYNRLDVDLNDIVGNQTIENITSLSGENSNNENCVRLRNALLKIHLK